MQVVAFVPSAGPVPPPSMVVTPDIRASSTCCGQMKWMCASKAPAVRILPSPAIASVPGPTTMSTPGWMSGLPALPMATMRPFLRPTSAFHDPPVIDDERVGDHSVDRTLRVGDLRLPHSRRGSPCRPPELHPPLRRRGREVPLDPDRQIRVRARRNEVSDGGAEHVGIGGAGDAVRAWAGPFWEGARGRIGSRVREAADLVGTCGRRGIASCRALRF